MEKIEDKDLIEKTYDLIREAGKIDNKGKLLEFIGNEESPRFKLLCDFYNALYSLDSKYLYKNIRDINQSELSFKFQEIYKWIIANRFLFIKSEDYWQIPDNLISYILDQEENHANNLERENIIIDASSEFDHKKFREDIEAIIISKSEQERTHNEICFLDYHDKYYSRVKLSSIYQNNEENDRKDKDTGDERE